MMLWEESDVAGNMRPSASVLSGYTSGAGKPIDGVLGLKLRKSLLQGFASAGIASWSSGQALSGWHSLRCSAPSTGNFDLGEHLVGFLKNYDIGIEDGFGRLTMPQKNPLLRRR